jgi:hypothetical protein
MPPVTLPDLIGFAAYQLAVGWRLDMPLLAAAYRRAREGTDREDTDWLPGAGTAAALEPGTDTGYDAAAVPALARGVAATVVRNRRREALRELAATAGRR